MSLIESMRRLRFDRAHYTGGWAATISQNVTFPSDVEELLNYSGMSIELLRGCPDEYELQR